MTTPPTPPAPPPAPAPAPAPPAPAPAPGPKPAEPPASAEDIARMRATLDQERLARKDAEAKLAAAQQASMTEQERAVATARAEGKAEAEALAAQRLAAAEFRILAAGRLANPEGALAVIDMSKLVQKNGEPNRQAIAALVEQLAPQQAAGNGHVIPAGARTAPAPAAGQGDWLRNVSRGPRR